MNDLLNQFRYNLESLFYFYLNMLEISRKKHSESKIQLQTVLKTLANISKELTKRENILKNPIITIKNYNKPVGEDLLHQIPHIIAVEHSLPNGYHENLLASSIITESYNLWEDKYRALIANSIKLNKDDIKNDFWGEARNYRRSIVHNKKKAIKEIESCTILPKFSEGSQIDLSDKLIVQFINESIKSLDDLKNEYSG